MCLCNMFISNKDYVNDYCEFVFNWCKIYTEFEKSCNNEIPPRMFGYLTETFTRAYLLFKNKKIKFNRVVFKPSFK